MDRHARVVVIGGGNMGAGVLYHLAKAGWKDCVLIEKAELTSGATWHAVGLVTRMVASHTLGTIHDYAIDFYKSIEAETRQNVSWHNCGSLRVGSTDSHVDWLMHIRDVVSARGRECHWLGPNEVKTLNPLYDVSKIRGALFTPDDGHVDPSGACQAMAKGARQFGAEIIRRNRVTDIKPLPSGEWRVITENGSFTCEHVVNAGGYHARQIGQFVGLDLPILPIQHHYVVTDAVPEFAQMSREIPVTRDDYFTGYIRREQAGALIGLYDTHAPVPKWADGCPWKSESELFEPDWDSITPWLERSFERCPSLRELGIKRVVNGALTCTPDGAPLLGPVAGLRNFWLACGATGGIMWGPGAGKYLAQWIMDGGADISMRIFDPRRFGPWVDRAYAVDRIIDDYAHRLNLPYPQDQHYSCRNRRLSGAHGLTSKLGAVYEEIGGRERPRFYAPADWNGREPRSWRRTAASDIVNREAKRVYESVGIGDFSPFAKFEISGAGSREFLDRVCANRVPKKPGNTCLTTYLNRRGTIEGEATIACLGEDRYWFVTGGPSELRAWDWLNGQLDDCARVKMSNRTGSTGVLTVAGPSARDTLQACTSADLSNEGFGWLKARELEVAGVPVIALRLSFTGELAWELHAPMRKLDVLWKALWDAGAPHKIAPFGSAAMNAMRMEKAYRGGLELGGDTSPIHAGIMHFVKLDKEFVGRDAVIRRMEKGEASTLAYLEVDAEDQDCLGGEIVLAGEKKVGSITSGAFGPITGKSLAFAYVEPRFAAHGTELHVSILGHLRRARVLDRAVRDPDNLRLKA